MMEARINVLPDVTVCPPPVRPPVANKREFVESTSAKVSASPVAVTFPPVTFTAHRVAQQVIQLDAALGLQGEEKKLSDLIDQANNKN